MFFLFLFPLLLSASPILVPRSFYSGFEAAAFSFDQEPLITEMGYRELSDHIIDQSSDSFDPALVKQGDILYVNIWYLPWFEKEVHDAIQAPYILLTCDVGDWLPNPELTRLLYDPKLAAWFCRNLVFSYHPKLFQLPMGQNDRVFSDLPLQRLKKMLAEVPFPKTHFLYMNHFPRPFGDRDKIVALFEYAPYCFTRNRTKEAYEQISRERYFDELACSQFVISPFGLETDCVRTWEALALHCIPIVEHTFLDPLYDGMPVVFVHEWYEVNEAFLKEQLKQLKDKSWERALIAPWRDWILQIQQKVREGDLSFAQLEAMEMSSADLDDLRSILQGHTKVICRGFLSGVHALQLAETMEKVYLCDPWLDKKALRAFTPWQEHHRKLNLISFKAFDAVFETLKEHAHPLFFDFSYYRNSLMRDPTLKQMRHSLRKDLSDLYFTAAAGTLFCGNRADELYVKGVLERLCREYPIHLERRGDYWFFVK